MARPMLPRNRLHVIAGGFVAALLTAVLWPATHASRPLLPTDDLYTHLTVARHLARGEGFQSDIAYPLSFAWSFGRELPQPLMHRPPGWSTVLLMPYAAAGGDADATIKATRVMQIGWLAFAAALGTGAWLRRQRAGAAAGWLVALLFNPVLPYAVDWGQSELLVSVVLLGFWLRHREGARTLNVLDGACLGALTLLRPEVLWLPLGWWFLWRPRGRKGHRDEAETGADHHRLKVFGAAAMFVVLTGPWAVRNLALTGNPFFNVQAYAEMVKDTKTWPGYDVYRQLDPQPAWRVLRDDPVPILRKTARGIRFYARELPSLVPWPLLVLLAAGLAAPLGRAVVSRKRTTGTPASGLSVAGLSTLALMAFYAPFDHSLRHLAVLIPIIAWETAPLLFEVPCAWLAARRPDLPGIPTGAAAVGTAVVAALVVVLCGREPTGWAEAAAQARAMQPMARGQSEQLRVAPPGPAFVESAAAPWFADRPAVWSPLNDEVRRIITGLLSESAPFQGKP